MSAITTKFVTDHKLTNEMGLEELSRYALEILELLTTGAPKVDKEKRRQALRLVIVFKKDISLAKNRHMH